MKRNILFIATCLLGIPVSSFSQGVKIGDTPGSPDASSILEIQSTDKGLLPPRLSTAERDAIDNPAQGLLLMNMTTGCLEVYLGTAWQAIGCGCTTAPNASPSEGDHFEAATSITWNWAPAGGASGYKWSTTNSYASASDVGSATSYTQNGFSCDGPSQTSYVWAYNACGVAGPTELTASPATTPIMDFITGTFTVLVGETTQYTHEIPGGTWSSDNVAIATVDNNGLVMGVSPGTTSIVYTVNNNGCSSYVTQDITVALPCGGPITINHIGGAVAPANKTVNYGTVSTAIGGTGSKCWITQNLGAANQASSATDASEASAGWYWKFNSKRGYSYTSSPTPSWSFTNINDHVNWSAANDPCTIELGSGWRIPTQSEWSNADAAPQSWNSYTDAFNSVLKLHSAGYIVAGSGSLDGRGTYGLYWSSTSFNSGNGWSLRLANDSSYMLDVGIKDFGFSIRCIRD